MSIGWRPDPSHYQVVLRSVVEWIYRLEMRGHLVRPVEVTIYDAEDTVVAHAFYHDAATFRLGSLNRSSTGTSLKWPLVAILDDLEGNAFKIAMEARKAA